MRFGDPEIETDTSCSGCGCHSVFAAVAPPGERERPIYMRCCECGVERADVEFYETA
jgi:hypothetical protein